jgi:hypothetical protein
MSNFFLTLAQQKLLEQYAAFLEATKQTIRRQGLNAAWIEQNAVYEENLLTAGIPHEDRIKVVQNSNLWITEENYEKDIPVT